jgi:putative oxidoreductase
MKRNIGLGNHGRYERLALALLRVYTGGVILLAHAVPKLRELLAGGEHFINLVAGMGLPFPLLFAWLAMLTQVAGSLCIVVGFLTRLAAVAVASTIGVGMIGVHLGDPFSTLEVGITYLVLLIALSIGGSGAFAVDGLLPRRYSSSI